MFIKTRAEILDSNGQHKGKDALLAYPLGEKIIIDELDFEVGGGGTNTAVAFSRLGLRTGYIGKIGKDENGLKIFNLLKKENIGFLGSLGNKSGYSVILDSKAEDRTILVYKGCNDFLKYGEIQHHKMFTDWFYFGTMRGESLKTLKKLADYALSKNIKVAFNASYYVVHLGLEKIDGVLKATNILILNKEEAQILSKKKDINGIVKTLKKHVKDYIVITDGKNGAYCYDGKKLYSGKPSKNLKIRETTGAGDAYASGFTAGIMQNKSVDYAMRMGFIESEAVIQSYGAKNNLPTKSKMNSMIKKDRRKIYFKNI